MATQIGGPLQRELAQRLSVGVMDVEAEMFFGPHFGFATHFGLGFMNQAPNLSINAQALTNLTDDKSFSFLWFGVDVLKVRVWRNDYSRSHVALALGYYGFKNPAFPAARVLFVNGRPTIAIFEFSDFNYNGLAVTADAQFRIFDHLELSLKSTIQPFINGSNSFGTLNDVGLRFYLYPYWRSLPNVAFHLGYRLNVYSTRVQGILNLIDGNGNVVSTTVNEQLTDIFQGPVLGVYWYF